MAGRVAAMLSAVAALVWAWEGVCGWAEKVGCLPHFLHWTLPLIQSSHCWSADFASPGRKHRIPYLWTYFALVQILPSSLTFSVLQVGILLRELRETQPQRQEEEKVSELGSAATNGSETGMYAILLIVFLSKC
jgi:hypothetical protein